MSDGNQLPPAGETACPTDFAKRLIQQGGAGGFACRSNGHNQSASKMNKFQKTVKHQLSTRPCAHDRQVLHYMRWSGVLEGDGARALPALRWRGLRNRRSPSLTT